MNTEQQVTETTVVRVTRLPNSVNGNPRYVLYTENGVFRTAPDIMDAYKVTDSYAGKRVRLEWKSFYGYSQVFGIDIAGGSE